MNTITYFLTLFMVIENMLLSCHGTNSSYGCKEAERNALLTFKRSFSDPSHKLSSWQGEDCCEWKGIVCDSNTRYVVKVDLRSNFNSFIDNTPFVLRASKLDTSLLQLRYLNFLDLSGNDFNRSLVPEFLGEMNGLTHLNLSYANFNRSSLPPQLGNLTNLQVFDVSDYARLIYNHFTQSIEWLSTLSSLRVLYMNGVNLSRVRNLLPMLNKLPFLSVLSLSQCELDDSHLSPTTYANLTFLSSIQELHLSRNSFLSFPPLLKNMTSLRVLDISVNTILTKPYFIDISHLSVFNCSIPVWLADLKDLEYLHVSGPCLNKVEGGLWRFLSGLCHLKTLYLACDFIDQVGHLEPPEWNKNISWECVRYDLEVLSVTDSGLTGVLPDELGQFKKLTHIDLSYNALHGSIHALLGYLTALIEINLGYNQLTGTIPPSIGNLSSLEILDLSNNQLSGVVPDIIGQLVNLYIIDVSSNRLTGSIHALLGNLTAFTKLRLGNNQLNGTIPSSIGNLSSLVILDLSNNQLSGVVPDIIRQLVNLNSIDVSSNHLTGQISETHFSNAAELRELFLSSNQFTITITSDWKPPFQLVNLGMASCKIGPLFPRWIGTQLTLETLDLSFNRLTDADEGAIRYLEATDHRKMPMSGKVFRKGLRTYIRLETSF